MVADDLATHVEYSGLGIERLIQHGLVMPYGIDFRSGSTLVKVTAYCLFSDNAKLLPFEQTSVEFKSKYNFFFIKEKDFDNVICNSHLLCSVHDDVIIWKHFQR